MGAFDVLMRCRRLPPRCGRGRAPHPPPGDRGARPPAADARRSPGVGAPRRLEPTRTLPLPPSGLPSPLDARASAAPGDTGRGGAAAGARATPASPPVSRAQAAIRSGGARHPGLLAAGGVRPRQRPRRPSTLDLIRQTVQCQSTPTTQEEIVWRTQFRDGYREAYLAHLRLQLDIFIGGRVDMAGNQSQS
jgi:hypothetical protein